MKILITHEIFPPEFAGGGEKLTLKLIKLLVEKGHEVRVVTSGDPKIKDYEGIPTTRLKMNRYLMNLALPTILKEAKDVDIIQTSTGNVCLSSWLASKLLKRPICCHVHHLFGPYWNDVRGSILGRIFQVGENVYLKRSYDALVFQNFTSKNIGLKMKLDEEKMHIIQPGIDWNNYQMKIKKEPFILFVGNFKMDKPAMNIKGLRYLLEAAEKLPDVNFLIAGGGPEIDKIKKYYKKNIIFTGPLVGKTLIELYNRALIFCYPSLTEGFGISLLEAMASGCATISSIDIGQQGIKIEPKNTNQIVNSIKYLINNEKEAKRIGINNRKIAKKFTWKKFIDDYSKLYESLTK